MIEEEKRLKESLEKMKAAGKQIKGYDLTSGRLRDVIASMTLYSLLRQDALRQATASPPQQSYTRPFRTAKSCPPVQSISYTSG